MVFIPNKKTKNNLFVVAYNPPYSIETKIPEPNFVSANITDNKMLVHNTKSKITSEKSLYLNKDQKLYFNGGYGYGNRKRYFIDELVDLEVKE